MQRSSTAVPPKVHAAHLAAPERQGTETPGKNNRPLKFVLIGAAVLLLALVASLPVYDVAHNGRIFRGVSVLGTDLGGMDTEQARAALAQSAAGYPSGSLTVEESGHTWTFNPADLGVGIDVDKTLASALAVGRSADLMGNFGSQLNTLFGGKPITPALKNDPALIDKAVAQIAADLDKPAVNSTLKMDSGNVVLSPSSHGSMVDREATKASFLSAVASVPFSQARVVMQDAAPKITEDMLRSAESQALLLISEPVTLQSGEQSWTLSTDELSQMLDINDQGETTQVKLNDQQIAAYLQPVAEAVQVEPKNATVVIGKGTVTLKKDVPGSELDTAAAVAAIQQAASASGEEARAVDLPLKSVPAARHTADVQALYDKADALISQGVRMRFRDDGYIMRGAAVTNFIDVAKADEGTGLKLVVDEDTLANQIGGIAYYVNRPAADARFRMVNGAPTRVAEAKEGLKVDTKASTAAAVQAIEAYTGGDRLQVDMSVAVTQPSLTDANIADINTPDLLGTGQTSYAGSSPERAWNVGLGTRNVDGALIPPGGTFSTVDTIGDLTLAAGFKMGYAIVNTGAGITTVPAEAGGICQVATTLFHSVFWSGLPVVERNWHSYWISTYGVKPSGMQGLDATIAPPEKDFRFKNTTGHWILIKATADGKTVTFQLYGVKTGWNVSVSGPVITHVVKTSQAPVTEYSDKLPSGKKVLVEHAQDGFDAQITRTVTDASGNVIDKWVAKSHYQPAHNRTLIGTGN